MFPNDKGSLSASLGFYVVFTQDPTIYPFYGSRGTIGAWVGASGSGAYQKMDDGVTTNWNPLVSGIGGDANKFLSNLLSPTAVNQDLIMNVGKTLILPYDTYLKAKDSPGTGTRDIIKDKLDAANPGTYISQLGQRLSLISDLAGAFDISGDPAGTYRGMFAWLASTGISNQSLRGVQGSINVEGGTTGAHVGVTGTVNTFAPAVSISSVRAFNGSVSLTSGVVSTAAGIVTTNSISAGSITGSMQGASFGTSIFGTTTSVGSATGINNTMSFGVGSVTNSIHGVNTSIQFTGITSALEAIGSRAQLNLNGGVYAGQVTGSWYLLRTRSVATSFVSANEMIGSRIDVNHEHGIINNGMFGVRSQIGTALTATGVNNGMTAVLGSAIASAGTITNVQQGGYFYAAIDNAAVTTDNLYGFNSGANVYAGTVTTDFSGGRINVGMASAGSVPNATGISVGVGFSNGTITGDARGGWFGVYQAGTPVSCQNMYGIDGYAAANDGSVVGGIFGANFGARTSGAFVGCNGVSGLNVSTNLAAGAYTGNIYGSSTFLWAQPGFVSAPNGFWGSDVQCYAQAGAIGEQASFRGTMRIYGTTNVTNANGINLSNEYSGGVVGNLRGIFNSVRMQGAATTASEVYGYKQNVDISAGTIAGALRGIESNTTLSGTATASELTGLQIGIDIAPSYATPIGNVQTAVFGYNVQRNVAGGGSRCIVVTTIGDFDGDAPQHAYRVYNTGFTNRTAANPLQVAFGIAGVLNDATKTFSHGLDLYMGVPFRTCDIQMAMGAQIKNAVANEIDFGANKLKNLVNGTANQDAVTVAQLNAAVGGEGKKELYIAVGGGGDSFFDLLFEASVDSISIDWWQNGHLVETMGANIFDYNVSYTGGVGSVTRINFEAALIAALNAGDKIIVQYEHV